MKNYLTVTQAATKAEVTGPTIINWCRRYGIGIKVGGRWRVSPEKLEEILQGGNPDEEND